VHTWFEVDGHTTGVAHGVIIVLKRYDVKPSNQPLQSSGTRLQAGAERRAGSCQPLNGGVDTERSEMYLHC
jgi:hypothetical protein